MRLSLNSSDVYYEEWHSASSVVRFGFMFPGVTAGRRNACRESTASHTLPARLFLCLFYFVLSQLALGIVSCSCQLHCESKETFRLAIEKSVFHEGLDGGYRTS